MSVPVRSGDWWYVTSSTSRGRATRSTTAGPPPPRRRRRSCSTRTSKPRATTTSTSARSTCRTTTRWWRGRSTPTATSTTRCTSATSRPAIDLRRRDRRRVATPASPGRATARACSTSPPTTRSGPYRVWRHAVGARPADADDVLVFEETDERYFVGVGETRSDDFVVIQSASKTSSEMRLISTDDPTGEPDGRAPRGATTSSTASTTGATVLIMHTNDDAVDFRHPRRADDERLDRPRRRGPNSCRTSAGRRIIGADPFAEHLVISEWADAQPRLRILFRDGVGADRSISGTHRTTSTSGRTRSGTTDAASASARSRPRCRRRCTTRTSRPANATLLKQVPTPNVDLDRYRSAPDVGHGDRRRAGADRHRAPRRHAARRHGAGRDLRVRRLRGVDAAVVLGRPAVAARSWLRVGARASPWRRRARPAVVPRRQARVEGEHVHRHDRLRRAPHRQRGHRAPTGCASAAARPAACSSVRASRCAPICSPARSPRCRSSTSCRR